MVVEVPSGVPAEEGLFAVPLLGDEEPARSRGTAAAATATAATAAATDAAACGGRRGVRVVFHLIQLQTGEMFEQAPTQPLP